MKTTFKKSTLTVLITSLLSTFAYSKTTVNVDGSFTTPTLDTQVTSDSIKEHVNNLLNDTNLNQDTFTNESTLDGDYYVLDKNGNKITENSVLNVTSVPMSLYGTIYGGYCEINSDCAVENTNVIIRDSSVFPGYVYGAYSSFSATGNVYLMDDALIGGDIYGAYSSSVANGNVYLMDYAIGSGNIYGAYSEYYPTHSSVTASGNVYLMDYATVRNDIYGAYSSGTANGNIYLMDNVKVASNIYGASAASSASGNVYIYGNVKLQDDRTGLTQYNTEIWGGDRSGYLASGHNSLTDYNVFNNNLLSIGNAPLTVKTVGNFAHYDFYLNNYNKSAIESNTALLTVTRSIENHNTVEDDGAGGQTTTQNKSTIRVAGISGNGVVGKGSQITLIDASGSDVSFQQGNEPSATVDDISDLFKTQDGDKDTGVKVGLAGEADISYRIDKTNNKIIAIIDDYRISQDQVNLNVKPLAEGRLAVMQNVVRGADLLVDVMPSKNEAVGTFTPIAVINGGVNKYKSGSHVDSRDYRVMVGSRYQVSDNLYTGLTLEYGRSNYDTYNDADVGNIHGKGNTYNYGASLFTKFSRLIAHDHKMYVEGAFRFGRTSNEFDSSDIVTGSGDAAYYNSKVNYLGAHMGLGFIYTLDELNSFDTSVRYLWTRLGSDGVVLDGDKVNFDKSNSSRVQLKEQYNRQATDNLMFSLAGIYEYEFDGDADANISGVSIDAPSVKGATGIIELGVKGTPIADNRDFFFNLSFKGYGGKRQGASASAFVQYNF